MTESNSLLVEIVTPEAAFYSKEVYMINMPGSEGEFGVLFGHVSLLAKLQPGIVTIFDAKMQIIDRISITEGFAEITDKSVSLLVEQAEHIANGIS